MANPSGHETVMYVYVWWMLKRAFSTQQLQWCSAAGEALACVTDAADRLHRGRNRGVDCCISLLVTGAIHTATV